jgi:hypothetical protein
MVVGRLTTYAQFIVVAHPFTRKDTVKMIIRWEIVRMLGFLTSRVSDRNRVFLSSF